VDIGCGIRVHVSSMVVPSPACRWKRARSLIKIKNCTLWHNHMAHIQRLSRASWVVVLLCFWGNVVNVNSRL